MVESPYQLAREPERRLVISIVHPGTVSEPMSSLVPLQDDRQRAFHVCVDDRLAVHLEHAGAASPDAADVVERQRTRAQSRHT